MSLSSKAHTSLLALCFGALLPSQLGCTSTSPPPASSAQESSTSEGSAPTDSSRSSSKEELPGTPIQWEAEAKVIEEIRQLKFLEPVQGRLINTEDLLSHLQQTFRENLPEHALLGTEELLVALGVVPFSFHYEKTFSELLQTDLAGLYDPRRKVMFLREELEGEARATTLLHELVHALQDQHYDLRKHGVYREDATDESSALSCLAEGDATSAMFDGMLLPLGQTALDLPEGLVESQLVLAAATDESSVPPLIRRSLLAPYLDGYRFIQQLRRRGGFAEVDRVWKNLPKTTEQILHLDKYDQAEPAVPVDIPAPPPTKEAESEFSLLLHDIWGEQSLRILLEEWVEAPQAAQAASGWGGDRIALYQRGTEYAAAWRIVSDDESSAKRLFEALTHSFKPAQKNSSPADMPCQTSAERGAFAFARKGKTTVIVVGPYFRQARASGSAAPTGTCASARAWLQTLLHSSGL